MIILIKGYLSLILHSHLPFVRHPDINEALEERWLFEAMSECYIPLIESVDRLLKGKVKFKITMSITPTLMAMLEDDYLNDRYVEYLNKTIELTEKELVRTFDIDTDLNNLSKFYYNRYQDLYSTYKEYNNNLMNAFRKFDKLGCLEIIACAATHGILPLLMVNPETVKAQIATGVKFYEDALGHPPKGIWLPECAYSYELDDILKENGIEYFIIEGNALQYASNKPEAGTYLPIATPNGVCVFGRDMESGHQVWSSTLGYPGDPNYREFYRDIGHDLPKEYIDPYINPDGIRIDTGIKYCRITGNTDNKEYYNRDKAIEVAKNHAVHFLNSRNAQVSVASARMNKPPIITCPYDTELFGHWWFEGPDFLFEFIRKVAEEGNYFQLISPSDYLKKFNEVQINRPNPSSWGENSDFSVWLNSSNDWIYRKLHKCAEKMIYLANIYDKPTHIEERALNQAARELMLAEASDWPFIIKTNTTVEYATKRVNTHVERFDILYEEITNKRIDEKWLKEIEKLDNIFPKIDYRIYKSK